MMQVRVMRVPVNHAGVCVGMRMSLPGGVARTMDMLMVLIMIVGVLVRKRIVDVLVHMPLCDV